MQFSTTGSGGCQKFSCQQTASVKIHEREIHQMLLKKEKCPPVPEMWELQISLLGSVVITMEFAWFYSAIHILLWTTIRQYLG